MGFLSNFFSPTTENINNNTNTIHKHGHRCYTDGLNLHEQELVNLLARELSARQYFIFNNLIIPSSNTVTTQIDHVVVSEYGIFVIESKDYRGWIFGHKHRKNWTVCYQGGKKIQFQNPILQNFAHISALKEQLPFLHKCFFNLVVFSDNCEFKTERISNVLYSNELVENIKYKRKKWINEDQMVMAIGKLLHLCQTNNIDTQQHISNLAGVHGTTANANSNTVSKVPLK